MGHFEAGKWVKLFSLIALGAVLASFNIVQLNMASYMAIGTKMPTFALIWDFLGPWMAK